LEAGLKPDNDDEEVSDNETSSSKGIKKYDILFHSEKFFFINEKVLNGDIYKRN